MQDKATARSLDESITRMTATIGRRYMHMDYSPALGGWRIDIPLHDGESHPDEYASERVDYRALRVEHSDIVTAVEMITEQAAQAIGGVA
ncbi:hypothetical protein ACFTSD_01400 [Nocardiaceae bacterium NPDC056970]